MKRSLRYLFLLFAAISVQNLWAQQNLPIGLTEAEQPLIFEYTNSRVEAASGIITPPQFSVRTMAEWEEIQSIAVTWKGYTSTLREIVRYAKEECQVIIICSDSNSVKSYLNAGGVDDVNVDFIEDGYNTIWMRDYGGNTIYRDDVDTLMMVDWIYNRPRPLDDILPETIASYKGIPIYSTTVAPYDLVHTGGNFMTDGFGTAFSSNLVLDENDVGGIYNQTVKTAAEVDSIMFKFMGIDNYIKMTVLPYDGIHHIDMHMKLLDEETILVGEYPSGVADGPQIEANLQYVLSNFNSMFGTPYDIVRIEMPPEGGSYPDNWAAYRTFTNSVFINKTVLVPLYEEQYDTTALRIYRENLPGYRVEGINCNSIIQSGGALHCITRAIGVEDPLLISHQPLSDITSVTSFYQIEAVIKHRSDISTAMVYYSTDTSGAWSSVAMINTDPANDIWTGNIPSQSIGATVYYYIGATSISGKQQVRPIVAPKGFWNFEVLSTSGSEELTASADLMDVFPNPASAITCIPINSTYQVDGSVSLYNVLGELVDEIYNGSINHGTSRYFFDASQYNSGLYLVVFKTDHGEQVQKIAIK